MYLLYAPDAMDLRHSSIGSPSFRGQFASRKGEGSEGVSFRSRSPIYRGTRACPCHVSTMTRLRWLAKAYHSRSPMMSFHNQNREVRPGTAALACHPERSEGLRSCQILRFAQGDRRRDMPLARSADFDHENSLSRGQNLPQPWFPFLGLM